MMPHSPLLRLVSRALYRVSEPQGRKRSDDLITEYFLTQQASSESFQMDGSQTVP